MTRTRIAALAILAFATADAAVGAACAQGMSSGGLGANGFQPPVKGGGVVPPPNLPAPPALPGAARHGTAAPASKPASDMPPTDALFDAINRGDMASARDALSRGADIEGRNVLGMTPMELSVDLGRSDITFLLLSMRGAGPQTAPSGAATAVSANMLPGKPARTAAHSRNEAQLSATVRAARPAPEATAPGLPPANVRYAGSNPGAAVPQAGFLGFGGQP